MPGMSTNGKTGSVASTPSRCAHVDSVAKTRKLGMCLCALTTPWPIRLSVRKGRSKHMMSFTLCLVEATLIKTRPLTMFLSASGLSIFRWLASITTCPLTLVCCKATWLTWIVFTVSTKLGLLQSNMTYMNRVHSMGYHWLPDLLQQMGLPLLHGVEAVLKQVWDA